MIIITSPLKLVLSMAFIFGAGLIVGTAFGVHVERVG